MFLIDLARPNLIVELGTQYGDSYCAFCQAVQELNLGTRSYAVDTWEGDAHTGFYGPEVLQDLRAHHDPLYGNFSSLIRSTFDDASKHFSNKSIDLLHIDGYHTYEAVRHDFQLWLPKMSSCGVILFHDVNVREGDFGVWRLWEELRERYRYFEFVHGHGLGVLALGAEQSDEVRSFLDTSGDDVVRIRNFFFNLGFQLTLKAEQRGPLTQEVSCYQAKLEEQKQALVEKDQNVGQLTAERERLAEEIARLQVMAEEQRQVLLIKEQNAVQLTAERERLTQEISQQRQTIQKQQYSLGAKEQNVTQLISERERLLADKETERHRFIDENSQLNIRLQEREDYLKTIEDSLAWALVIKYRRVRDKLCPEGTSRRETYDGVKNFVKKLVSRQTRALEPKHEQGPLRNARFSKLTSVVRAFSGRPVWARHPRQIPEAVSVALSGLLEPSWYFKKNKDVAESGMSAIFHYLLYGAKEGRDPNPFFDTSWYTVRNQDVARTGMNPLVHYLRHGAREGRDPGRLFSTSYYLEQNPDVMRAGMNPLAHYLRHGIAEGRLPRRPEVERDARLNAELFPALPKWSGLEPNLAEYVTLRPPPPGPPWVLVVADRVPTPDMTSGSVRLSAILRLMHELELRISFISALRKEEYQFILEPGGKLNEYEEQLHSLGVSRITYGWDDAVQELKQNGWRYHFAFISFAEITYGYLPFVRAFAINAKVIYDTVDLHSLRVGREAEVSDNRELVEKGAYYQKIESCNVQCTDAVIAISDEEAIRIRGLAPQARVATIPNIHAAAPGDVSMKTRQDLLFIGHYLHTPNVDAVTFFVHEILPRIRKALPNVTIRLLGSNMPEAIRALRGPGVLPVGYIKDVRPFFDSSRVFVAPLRYGAGMKGKIGHAMSWGLPVVTTSIGAEGMALIPGEHALIADTPEAFADAVIQLYNDENLWEHISQAAVKHMSEHFSAEAVRPALATLFTENFYNDRDTDNNKDSEWGRSG
jgi:glycosyltransferase involved in cell wall biosynthesis